MSLSNISLISSLAVDITVYNKQQSSRGLTLELYALRDILPGEEVRECFCLSLDLLFYALLFRVLHVITFTHNSLLPFFLDIH